MRKVDLDLNVSYIMSPAVEQNIVKRMKKKNEVILKPRMKASSISRTSRKKETSKICSKNDSCKSKATNNSVWKKLEASPREMNRISPSVSKEDTTGIRYVAYPIATTVPFNRTLSTSTPDPEKQATPIHIKPENVAVHSLSDQILADQSNQKRLPQIIPKAKSAKLQQIVQNQAKTAQRKTLLNSQSKPNKTKSSSDKLLLDREKSRIESKISLNVPSSMTTEQNAVSFSIHQVNKVASKSQKLLPSQNSAFHQIVCNVPEMVNDSKMNPTAYLQKTVEDSCRHTRSKSPAFPVNENTPDISDNVHSMQSLNANLFSQSSDTQNPRPKSVPSGTSSQNPLLKHVINSTSSSPKFATTSPEAHFELYSQDKRLLYNEPGVPLLQYITVPTTENGPFMTAMNQKEQATDSGRTYLMQTEPHQTQVSPGQPFAPMDLQSRAQQRQNLVSFEEPVRDSDTQTKCKSSQEYLPTLNKADRPNLPGMIGAAAAINMSASSEPLCYSISDDEGVKDKTSDSFRYQNNYVQHPSSNIHDPPPLQWQSVEALAGAKTLRFMINELEEISKTTNQSEINRLVKQIQQVVNSLPQLSETFDLQTEIGLSLQPLRNENSQLRRRLRIVTEEANQEKERLEADRRRQTLELQLQFLNLEKKVDEEKLGKHQHLHQHEELVKELNLLKMERQRLIKDLDQRETTQFDLRRENWEENRKYLREIEILQKEVEQKVLALEASEKKNHILQITVEQRDMEISRMHDILHSAREGMKELVHNLCQSKDPLIPSEGIEKFFTFITQDPMSDCNSSVNIASAGDSAASTNPCTASSVNSTKGSTTNIQKAALESSVNNRLQELLDTMKISCQNLVSENGTEQLQANSLVNNPQTNSDNAKDYLSSENQETSQTSCLPFDIKDSGFVASPNTENFVSISNGVDGPTSSNASVFPVEKMLTPGRLGSPRSSADVTRASISDYFAKYPNAKPNDQCSEDASVSVKRDEDRGLNVRRLSDKIMQNILQQNERNSMEAPSEFDVSSLSQYTVTTLSSFTGDVHTFRQGLASLDENIARLQASIKHNKNISHS